MKTCQGGQHSLVVIFESKIDGGSDAVVRWCQVCGCVVVDVDYDGRTNAGQLMQMKSPEIVSAYNELGSKKGNK